MQNKFQENPKIWTLKENEILTNLRVNMGESFDYLREVFPINRKPRSYKGKNMDKSNYIKL